jgi:hypothetical protein
LKFSKADDGGGSKFVSLIKRSISSFKSFGNDKSEGKGGLGDVSKNMFEVKQFIFILLLYHIIIDLIKSILAAVVVEEEVEELLELVLEC